MPSSFKLRLDSTVRANHSATITLELSRKYQGNFVLYLESGVGYGLVVLNLEQLRDVIRGITDVYESCKSYCGPETAVGGQRGQQMPRVHARTIRKHPRVNSTRQQVSPRLDSEPQYVAIPEPPIDSGKAEEAKAKFRSVLAGFASTKAM